MAMDSHMPLLMVSQSLLGHFPPSQSMVWLFLVMWSVMAEGRECNFLQRSYVPDVFLVSHTVSSLCLTSVHTWIILTRDLVHHHCILLSFPLVLRIYQHPLAGQMMKEHPANGFQNSVDIRNDHCRFGVPITILFLLSNNTLLLLLIHTFPHSPRMTTSGTNTFSEPSPRRWSHPPHQPPQWQCCCTDHRGCGWLSVCGWVGGG